MANSEMVIEIKADTRKFERAVKQCASKIQQLDRKLAWAELKIAFRNWVRSWTA